MAYQEFYEAIIADNGKLIRELIHNQLVDYQCLFVSNNLSLTTSSSDSNKSGCSLTLSVQNEGLQLENQQGKDTWADEASGGTQNAKENTEKNAETKSDQKSDQESEAKSSTSVETLPAPLSSPNKLSVAHFQQPSTSSSSSVTKIRKQQGGPLAALHIPTPTAQEQPSPPLDSHSEQFLQGAVGGTTVILDKSQTFACTEIRVEVSDASPDSELQHSTNPDINLAAASIAPQHPPRFSSQSEPRRKQYRFRFDSSSLSDSEDSPPGVNPLEGLDISDIRFSELKLNGESKLEEWSRIEVSLIDSQHFLRTPFTLAVKCHSKSAMEALMSSIPDVDVYQQDGWMQSPLHMALWSGQADLLWLMINSGCDVTRTFPDGCTPLHLAAKYGKRQCIELLLGTGNVLVNAVDSEERTALHMAAKHGHCGCLSLLIEAGGNVNHIDKRGHTPIHATESADCTSVLLSAGACPDQNLDLLDHHSNVLDIVTHHTKENHAAVVRVLLEAGYPANISHLWAQGRDTPLHWAICNANSECVDLLLKKGAIVNAQNTCGNTPLMVASTRYHTLDKRANYEDVQRIINAGCSLDMTNNTGQSALHMATKCRNLEFVKILVRNHADVNVVDTRSRTALMYTAMLSSADVLLYWNLGTDWEVVHTARLLLQANCDVHLRDKYRRTALVLAIPEVSVNGPQISEPLLTMLVLAGSRIPPKKVTSAWKKASLHSRLDPHERQALAKVVSLMIWLDAVRSNPVSLQQKCRLVVRRVMGTHIHSKVAKLNLPTKLKNYVLLKDLDEVVEEAQDSSTQQFDNSGKLAC